MQNHEYNEALRFARGQVQKPNQTREQAQRRVLDARVGCLASQPSHEYLYELLDEINRWKKEIEAEIATKYTVPTTKALRRKMQGDAA